MLPEPEVEEEVEEEQEEKVEKPEEKEKPEVEKEEETEQEEESQEKKPEKKEDKTGQTVPRARVDQLTREKWNERRAREAAEARAKDLEEENRKLKAPKTEGDEKARSQDPVEFDRLVDERANQKAAQNTFNQRCNDTFNRGTADPSTPGFKAAIEAFDVFGGLAKNPTLVQTAIELPDGHKVLHHLGTNLDEAERILALPPIRQAIELGRLADKLGAKGGDETVEKKPNKLVSEAPPPIKTVKGKGSVEVAPADDGDMPGATEAEKQENYRKWRSKQFKKR